MPENAKKEIRTKEEKNKGSQKRLRGMEQVQGFIKEEAEACKRRELCLCVCGFGCCASVCNLCTISVLSKEIQRHCRVTGLSQPRYVMLNLVAKT